MGFAARWCGVGRFPEVALGHLRRSVVGFGPVRKVDGVGLGSLDFFRQLCASGLKAGVAVLTHYSLVPLAVLGKGRL